MIIFSTSPGKVVALRSPGGAPAVLSLSGFPQGNVIITGIGVSQQANVQFQETLKDQVFIYSFGEKLGTSKIHGLAFWSPCSGGSGIPAALRYYSKNSVAVRRSPIKIAFSGGSSSGEVLSSYIVAVNLEAADPERGYASFSITVASLPL